MPFNRVNPPKQVVLPPKVANDLQLKKAFDDVYFILFQMWKRTGAGADFIDENQTNEAINHTLSKLFDIRQQIGS